MFKNVSPDLVRSGRTRLANLGVRSCPVRKLICPVWLSTIANWTCQLVKIYSMGFILHISTNWHPKFLELGTFCDTKSYNWHPLILGIQSQTGEKIVLSGAEVDTMSDVELQNVADKVINFFSLRIMLFSEIHSSPQICKNI